MKNTFRNLLLYTIPVLASFAALTAAVWGRGERARADANERLAEEYISAYADTCSRCGAELKDKAYELRAGLDKLKVTNSAAGKVLALEDVVRGTAEASALLSRIPQSYAESAELAAFLAQAGEYSRTLTKKLLAGETLSELDEEQLGAVLLTCGALSDRLALLIEEGGLPNGTGEVGYYEAADGIWDFDVTKLDYEGVYSDSALAMEPLGISGEEGSLEEAKRVAEEAAGVSLEYAGRTEGRIPSYDFTGDAEVSVSCRGSKLIWFMREPSGSSEGVPEEGFEGLLSAAEAFLERAGFGGMEPAFYEFRGGAALFSFTAKSGETSCLSDVIKVWIDRETGEPIGLDAREYLMYHCERAEEKTALSQEEARAFLSPALEVISARLVYHPTSPGCETLCWEFACSSGDADYLVRINASTGAEERILRLVRDGWGMRTE
jgi:hypothetical protein